MMKKTNQSDHSGWRLRSAKRRYAAPAEVGTSSLELTDCHRIDGAIFRIKRKFRCVFEECCKTLVVCDSAVAVATITRTRNILIFMFIEKMALPSARMFESSCLLSFALRAACPSLRDGH